MLMERLPGLWKSCCQPLLIRGGWSGNAEIQYKLADLHLDSKVKGANPDEGLRWLQASAEQDYRLACRRLGHIFLNNKVTDDTTQSGIYWLARAADLKDMSSCSTLGDLYLLGHNCGLSAQHLGRSAIPRIKPDIE